MKIYIAGPMTGYPNHNYEAFAEAAELWRASVKVEEVRTPPELNLTLQPPLHSNPDGSIDASDYARCFAQAVEAVLWCDAIVLLRGWMESRGAKLEAHLAAVLGKQFFLETNDHYEQVPTPHFHILVTSGANG